jgi:hypothetical protein
VALPLLAIAACATAAPEEMAGRCNVRGLEALIGRAATVELGAEAMERAGALRIRWIRPGDVVTMDYREDRLNIHLDGQNRVLRFICG